MPAITASHAQFEGKAFFIAGWRQINIEPCSAPTNSKTFGLLHRRRRPIKKRNIHISKQAYICLLLFFCTARANSNVPSGNRTHN